jgi:hypothetical protein
MAPPSPGRADRLSAAGATLLLLALLLFGLLLPVFRV